MASAKSALVPVSKQKSSVPKTAKRGTTAKSMLSNALVLNPEPLSGHYNFHYCVEVDVEDRYDHDTDSPGDMCRCRSIESARVVDVCHRSVAERFFKNQKKANPFMLYAVERILRAYLRPNTFDDFHVSWHHSYYGDEVGEVTMPVSVGLRKAISHLTLPIKTKNPDDFAMQLADRCVRESLMAEYGYFLPQLEGKIWAIEHIRRNLVSVPGVLQPLDRKVVESYTGGFRPKNTPMGIALATSAGYELIDGRHRFAALSEEKKICLIVGR